MSSLNPLLQKKRKTQTQAKKPVIKKSGAKFILKKTTNIWQTHCVLYNTCLCYFKKEAHDGHISVFSADKAVWPRPWQPHTQKRIRTNHSTFNSALERKQERKQKKVSGCTRLLPHSRASEELNAAPETKDNPQSSRSSVIVLKYWTTGR